MWRMQDGNRVLTEAEWTLFRTGLELLCDFIEEDIRSRTDDSETGIPVFDRLTPEQKLALLADSALALRDATTPMPRHTAVNEGAIAAVFSTIRVELEMELDMAGMEGEEKSTEIRRLLRAICEGTEEREEPLPDETAMDAEEWECLLEEFENRIFWDADFEMGDEFLDLPPDEAREKLNLYRIDPDYYLAVPDEPGEAGLIAARQKLARLLDLPVPNDEGLYPAILDSYHDLRVGPCSSEKTAAWEDNPWVQIISMCEPGWDCDYPTWLESFSGTVPRAPFQLQPMVSEDCHELPDRMQVERHGDSWVVRDDKGWYWCDLIDNCWAGTPDRGEPALLFPTEAAARAAYIQADRMYSERAARHEQARNLLGLTEE